MNKIIKSLLIFGLLLIMFCMTIPKQKEVVEAQDSEYTVVKDDTGATIYYRNSSEQVMRLSVYDYPTQELRACWVSLFVGSIPAYSTVTGWKSAYTKVLDVMEEYGLNCIIFHVRTHNNALYKSELNPIATWFSKVDFDTFDPLAWAIEETHKRSIEFHAWLNPYRVNDSFCAEDYPDVNPAKKEENLIKVGSSVILDPGIPSNRKFIVDSCMELVENYDVDAIHFDDYFYISGADDAKTRAKYNTENLSIANFRRKQVDLFIEELSKELRAYNTKNNECVQLGISPSGIYQNGSYATTPKYDANGNLISPLYSDTSGFAHYGDYLYSDTLNWINHEWIDYIMPQAYWAIEHTSASFAALTRWWSFAVKNKKVNLYMGMGIYMPTQTGSSATYWQKNTYEVRDQILNAAMYDEIGGVSFYSYNYITNTNKYIKTGMDILKKDYFSTKIPADVKKYYKELPSPAVTGAKVLDGILEFSAQDKVRGYIVYKVPAGKGLDTQDISQIYYYGTDTVVKVDDDGSTYYVSSVNLANVISTPSLAHTTVTAEYITEQINTIPEAITKKDISILTRIEELYNELADSEQAKVENYANLSFYYALIDAKEEAKEDVINYVSSDNYSIETWNKIRDEQTKVRTKIDAQKTVADISNLLLAYYEQIDAYPTGTNELLPIKAKAKEDVNNTYNSLKLEFYSDENQEKINQYKEQALQNIESSLSSSSISKYALDFITKVNALEDFEDLYNEKLESIKTYLKDYTLNEVERLDFLKDYEKQMDDILKQCYQALINYKPSTLIAEYEYITSIEETKIDQEINRLETLSKKIRLEVLLISDYSNRKEGASACKEKYISLIQNAKTLEEAERLFEEFQIEFDNLGKTEIEPVKPTEPVKKGCKQKTELLIILTCFTTFFSVFYRKRKN